MGDGVTDDTAAINLAISDGGRCAPGSCASTTTTPALVYFPPGTYVISTPIIDYYYTQLIGNPNCLPVIKATSNFTGIALIDGDPYGANGLSYGATNVFWRQVRNFILDQTNIPITSATFGIHWPTGQATSLQNIAFHMSSANGTQHQGLFIENGSGGFLTDLVFYGGLYGANIGNQQFTMRNLTFYNAVTAINQLYDWGWTYTGISINNCQLGFNLSNGGANAQSVGSVTLFDSEINNTPVGIQTAFTNPANRYTNGSLVVENVRLNNVPVAIQGVNGVVLAGTTGSSKIAGFGQGHAYLPSGPIPTQGPITPNNRPAGLQSGNAYYQRSKPQYEQYPASQFLSARTAGATGDGVTDDTAALQNAINAALAQKKFLFIDAGDYKVTSTVYIPAGSVIVGEAYPVILGSGAFFSNVNAPQPIVQIGKPGEKGTIEWSDAIVSTQGATAGAILFQYNLASPGVGSALDKRQGWENWSEWNGNTKTSSSLVNSPTSTSASNTNVQISSSSGASNTASTSNGQGVSTSTSTLSSSSYDPNGPHGGNKTSTSTSTSSGLSSTSGSVSSSGTSSGPYKSGSSSTTTTTPYKSGGTGTSRSSSTTSSTAKPTAPPEQPYTPTGPSGLWDVHARVGGFAGSNLQLPQCPTTAQVFSPPGPINANCIAAFLTMHITSSAANVYLENVWLWVADHDVEDPNLTQITVYAGRGLLVESTQPLWLWGTAVEHHTLYQYQFVSASTVFMGQIQTETAYYQPNPPALLPFAPNSQYSDPDFSTICFATTGFNFTNTTTFTNNCDGYGLRILNSKDILAYGVGLYSFFDNYNTSCSAPPTYDPVNGPYGCQTTIFSLEGANTNIGVYNLMTVGAQSMIDINGVSVASYRDNLNVFPDGIAIFRLGV